jgi:hypothetical protein
MKSLAEANLLWAREKARDGKISQSSELGQNGVDTRQYFWHVSPLPQK